MTTTARDHTDEMKRVIPGKRIGEKENIALGVCPHSVYTLFETGKLKYLRVLLPGQLK